MLTGMEGAMRLALALIFWAVPAGAECRLALALAMDVSRSIDAADFVIQTEGLALALEDTAVRRAILAGEGGVALAVYQWSGATHQELIQDWVLVAGPEELDRMIWAVRRAKPPAVPRLTALGDALHYGVALLDRAPPCARQILDMAGDGQGNDGTPVSRVRAGLDFTRLTVNALAIGEHEQGLVPYFRSQLIGGAGAFVEIAPRQIDYPQAIRRKLLRELAEPQVGALPGEKATERKS
jgi:hypothetical protein